MPLRSEHFITPIKLVLPGIIVSIMGLFVSNYIFNNPEKNRLAAIINLKIDSYNERRKNTESYLESMESLGYKFVEENYSTEKQFELTSLIQVKFYKESDHITNRDTAVINSILNDLTKNYIKYVDSFKVENKKQTVQEIQSFSIGKWLTTDNVLIDVNKDGTGHWKHIFTQVDTDFTGTFDTSINNKDPLKPRFTNLKIKFPNGNFFPIEILKANQDVLFIMFKYLNNHTMYWLGLPALNK